VYAPDATIEVTTDVGGTVTLAVDDRGGGDAVPLVLLHGFTGGRIDWADVIDDLAADRRVVAWDHRGHSDSTNSGDPATYTFEVLVADALAALDALGLDRFHLLGHSMGGVVAQHLVHDVPERVRSLVLMDTPPPGIVPSWWVDKLVAMARAEGMPAVAALVEQATGSMSVAPEDRRPAIAARNRHKLAHMDVEALAALGAALGEFESLDPWLAEISCPTTVLVGEFDEPLLDHAERLAEAVPGAVHVVVEGAAHSPQEERTEAWLQAVRAHLARADA
jgi:pimeloyl-ACP methyl ester carboxylesterase